MGQLYCQDLTKFMVNELCAPYFSYHCSFPSYSVDDLYAFELHQHALVPTYTLECTILRPGPVTALVPFCEI